MNSSAMDFPSLKASFTRSVEQPSVVSTINPTRIETNTNFLLEPFSAARLRAFSPVVQQKAEQLIDVLTQQRNEHGNVESK
jgi:hypothetical protein